MEVSPKHTSFKDFLNSLEGAANFYDDIIRLREFIDDDVDFYVAGGCVRDHLSGLESFTDVDIFFLDMYNDDKRDKVLAGLIEWEKASDSHIACPCNSEQYSTIREDGAKKDDLFIDRLLIRDGYIDLVFRGEQRPEELVDNFYSDIVKVWFDPRTEKIVNADAATKAIKDLFDAALNAEHVNYFDHMKPKENKFLFKFLPFRERYHRLKLEYLEDFSNKSSSLREAYQKLYSIPQR